MTPPRLAVFRRVRHARFDFQNQPEIGTGLLSVGNGLHRTSWLFTNVPFLFDFRSIPVPDRVGSDVAALEQPLPRQRHDCEFENGAKMASAGGQSADPISAAADAGSGLGTGPAGLACVT
jgi:hypothetical protein